jgi:hypothetical protein
VTVTIKNRDSIKATDVVVMRHFDADVYGDPEDDHWARSNESAFAVDGSAAAFGLSPGTVGYTHFSAVHTLGAFESLIGTCLFGAPASTPVTGDYVGTVGFSIGDIRAGGSKTVRFIYRSF